MNLLNSEDEIWKDVKGYENLYQVSNLGRVKSLANENAGSVKKEKILKPGRNGKSNYLVSLWKNGKGKMCIVKLLVWESFKGKPTRDYVIIQKDDNGKNNRLDNLEKITRREQSTKAGVVRGKTSKYVGVSKRSNGKWVAQININKKVKHLGYRDTEEEASALYQQALAKI
jgi:hypothetical protein